MTSTIESDETGIIFKVITDAEPDRRIIRSYIYISSVWPLLTWLSFVFLEYVK